MFHLPAQGLRVENSNLLKPGAMHLSLLYTCIICFIVHCPCSNERNNNNNNSTITSCRSYSPNRNLFQIQPVLHLHMAQSCVLFHSRVQPTALHCEGLEHCFILFGKNYSECRVKPVRLHNSVCVTRLCRHIIQVCSETAAGGSDGTVSSG